MNLTTLKRNNRINPKKRLGRGYGSGKGGHTVGRGQKGQKSRTGHKSTIMFEGGNVNLYRRMPKYRGWKNRVFDQKKYEPVNVGQLEIAFDDGKVVNLESLKEKKLVKSSTKLVKVLGMGELKKSLIIEGLILSETAKKKILAVKGEVK